MHQMAKKLLLLNLRSAPIIIPYFQPRIIPAIIIGNRLKFIAKNCIFIVINLSNIINVASNNAAIIIFLLFDIVCFCIYFSLPITLFYQNFTDYSIQYFVILPIFYNQFDVFCIYYFRWFYVYCFNKQILYFRTFVQ